MSKHDFTLFMICIVLVTLVSIYSNAQLSAEKESLSLTNDSLIHLNQAPDVANELSYQIDTTAMRQLEPISENTIGRD